MTNWWLNLYTIPTLKVLGKASLFVLGATLVFLFFAPSFVFIMHYGFLFIFNRLRKVSGQQLSSNLEFHKIHIPFNVLRKAIMLDYIIVSAAFFFVCVINYCLISLGETPDEVLVFNGASFMGFAAAILPLSALRKRKIGSPPKGHTSGLVHYLSVCGILLIMVLLFIFKKQIGIHPFVSLGVFFIGGVCASFFLHVKVIFHQIITKNNFRVVFKYNVLGVTGAVAFFSLLLFSTRPLIHNASVSAEVRQYLFFVNGKYAPELDVETAKDFLSLYNTLDDDDLAKIFINTPSIGQVPFLNILPNSNTSTLLAYLKYANPTQENLTEIDLDIQRSELSIESREKIVSKLASAWPKHAKLPDSFITKKMTLEEVLPKRVPANEDSTELE